MYVNSWIVTLMLIGILRNAIWQEFKLLVIGNKIMDDENAFVLPWWNFHFCT